jgi:hypothetical protein
MFVRSTTWALIVGAWVVGCSSSTSPASGSGSGSDSETDASSGSNSGSTSGSSGSGSGSGDDGTSSPDGSASRDASSSTDAGVTDAKSPADASHDGGTVVTADGATITAFEDFCNRRCARINACVVATDASADGGASCVSTCDASESSFTQYRGDYWTAVASCIEGSSCASILNGQASSACATTAQDSLTPSATIVSFCTGSTCPAADQIQDCQTALAPYTDAKVTALSTCITTMGCAMTATCAMAL